MRKVRFLIFALLLSPLTSPAVANAAATCSQLNVPSLADDNLTITVTAMTITEKAGSFQLTINYKMLNGTSDKKIDEGSFKIFYTDGSSEPQYGFFGTFFPGDSKDRSHTWEYLKSKTPMSISYNAGFFSSATSPLKLNWAPPGQMCSLVSPTAETSADKGSAGGGGAADTANAAVGAAAEATDTANAATDTANAATDAALAAADAGDAAAAAAQDASDSATPDGKDLMTINTQIQNLDIGYKNAAATLAKISIQLDKARAQITQLQKTMNAGTNSAIKQRLAVAISKLANAVLVLNSSKTKLEAQVKVIESRKNSLLTARDLLASNSANSKTGTSAKPISKEKTIVCTKGKSSLKVIGKNPKCPSGYKVKK
jgi:hypothetical protein